MGLCFRCEHRARFLETGARPRCECGDKDCSVHSCYMFTPCRPVILTRAPGYEDREVGLPAMLAPRLVASELAEDAQPRFKRLPGDRYLLYWDVDAYNTEGI